MTAAIRFENVSIVFGNNPTAALALMDRGLEREEIRARSGQVLGVHDCTLDVAEGEIVVLMGLSGSGKSTLLRAVNGLNPVTRGRCLVRDAEGDADPAACSPARLRRLRGRQTAMVFQGFGLLPWRSVRENVALGLELAGVSRRERRERAEAQLELVGLSDWGACKVSELSGGMRQRVGLARAFATEAPVLLMDEPFSALDPLIRARLQEELAGFQKRMKKTILFVSHDLDEAVKLGDRIAIMEGGRIAQTGTPKDILTRPADAYVADFVAELNPASVLKARDAARDLGLSGPSAHRAHLPLDAPLGAVLAQRAARGGPVLLGPETGAPAVAVVEDDALFRALAGRGAKEARQRAIRTE